MADYNAQVALGITPPDPNATMNSLAKILGNASNVLGIKQQQQNLETGKATQASAQAKATIDTQNATENQGIAKLLSDPVGNGIVDGEGNPTAAAQQKILSVAPTTGSQHYDNIIENAKRKVDFNNTVNGLNTTERGEIAGTVGGASASAQSPDDIKSALKLLVDSKSGTPVAGDYQRISKLVGDQLDHVNQATKGQNPAPPGQEPWRVAGQRIAQSTLPPSQTVGAGGVALPGAAQTGAGMVNRNPNTGALSQPPGGATGSTINPRPEQVAGATVANTSRAGGAGNADIDTSNMVVGAQRDAKANIDLTRRVDQLAEVVQPGAAASKISAGLGALGLTDVNQARTELQKDLGRLRGNLSARAGSDSRAATALEGLPTDTTPTQTIHQAMDVTRGMARQDLALGSLREKTAKATGGNMNGFQGDYAHAVGAASPLMHEYYSLPPADQVGFFKRNFQNKDQAKAFRAQAESAKKLSPDVVGQ
jgi:hypothetical protein